MRKKSIWLVVLMLSFLFACSSESISSQKDVNWLTYNEGTSVGEKQGKKVFISFYADWCKFCEKMKTDTFEKTEIVEYLNKHFVSIRVNADEERDIARKYFVRGLPVSLFLESNGEKISSLPGYFPPEMFIKVLYFINSGSYKTMSFQDFTEQKEGL